MPRPCKRRRICQRPGCARFGPREGCRGPTVTMTLDEFEAIRLIDLNQYTQEECAAQMNVARTTVQSIYASARVKLAECLVRQRELVIAGGEVLICDGLAPGCCRPCGRCWADVRDQKEAVIMKVAVTYENGQVFQHFGHTEQFKVYDIDGGKVLSAAVVDTNGSGHGALAGFLRQHQVDTLICGGIGGGAKTALAAAGIRLYGGVSGDADQAVADLLAGKLAFDPAALCTHHDEHHGEGCGEHHCC